MQRFVIGKEKFWNMLALAIVGIANLDKTITSEQVDLLLNGLLIPFVAYMTSNTDKAPAAAKPVDDRAA